MIPSEWPQRKADCEAVHILCQNPSRFPQIEMLSGGSETWKNMAVFSLRTVDHMQKMRPIWPKRILVLLVCHDMYVLSSEDWCMSVIILLKLKY